MYVLNLRGRCRDYTSNAPAPILREAETDLNYARPFLPQIYKHLDIPDIPELHAMAFSCYQCELVLMSGKRPFDFDTSTALRTHCEAYIKTFQTLERTRPDPRIHRWNDPFVNPYWLSRKAELESNLPDKTYIQYATHITNRGERETEDARFAYQTAGGLVNPGVFESIKDEKCKSSAFLSPMSETISRGKAECGTRPHAVERAPETQQTTNDGGNDGHDRPSTHQSRNSRRPDRDDDRNDSRRLDRDDDLSDSRQNRRENPDRDDDRNDSRPPRRGDGGPPDGGDDGDGDGDGGRGRRGRRGDGRRWNWGACPNLSGIWIPELERVALLRVHFRLAERTMRENKVLYPNDLDPERPEVHPEATYSLLPKFVDSYRAFPALKEAANAILHSPLETTYLEFRDQLIEEFCSPEAVQDDVLSQIAKLRFPTDPSKVDEFIRTTRTILEIHSQAEPTGADIEAIREAIVNKVPKRLGKAWVDRISTKYTDRYGANPNYSRKFWTWLPFDRQVGDRLNSTTVLSCLRDVCMLDSLNSTTSFSDTRPLQGESRYNNSSGEAYPSRRDNQGSWKKDYPKNDYSKNDSQKPKPDANKWQWFDSRPKPDAGGSGNAKQSYDEPRARTQSNFTDKSVDNPKPKRGTRPDGVLYYNPDSDIDLEYPIEGYDDGHKPTQAHGHTSSWNDHGWYTLLKVILLPGTPIELPLSILRPETFQQVKTARGGLFIFGIHGHKVAERVLRLAKTRYGEKFICDYWKEAEDRNREPNSGHSKSSSWKNSDDRNPEGGSKPSNSSGSKN